MDLSKFYSTDVIDYITINKIIRLYTTLFEVIKILGFDLKNYFYLLLYLIKSTINLSIFFMLYSFLNITSISF